MTLSARMRWTGPPLNLDPWVEGKEIEAGRLGVIVAALGDLSVAVGNYASCVCEFAAGVENVGDGGGGPDPDPLPPWEPTWGCQGRTTVLYAPATSWVPRTLPNGNVVPNNYWNEGVVIGGELVTAGVQFGPVQVDIDEAGGFPPQNVYGLYVETANYAIPNIACMRADGTYANAQGLYFQRLPLTGYPIGSVNDQDFHIPSFNFTLPNNGNPDAGLMSSPGFRSLKTGYAYVLFCQVDGGTIPDFDVYWGF